MSKGNTVSYAEQNEKCPDIMKILVGNIPPNKTIEIQIHFSHRLEVVHQKLWKLVIPCVLTPRYQNEISNDDNNDISKMNLSFGFT